MIIDRYSNRVTAINSLLCVGLDSDLSKLPESFLEMAESQFEFNKWIIDQTHEFAAAFKINSAFYEARGEQGWRELKLTMDYLHQNHPDIFTIVDAKRADIGSTNQGYVTAFLDELGFDAITLHPYLGKEALMPFLERKDKVSIILCRTSNPGAGEFQDLKIDDKPLWEKVAHIVTEEWNSRHNCMMVVGATYPKELSQIRKIAGDMTFLVPGIGTQGGSVEAVIKVGLNSQKQGLIINSSRGIIFDKNPRLAAKNLRDEINSYRLL
jgi:orotidine-5'-phosphate decarboxylase